MTNWFKSTAAPPSWLRWFANDSARAIIDNAAHAPIGCHFHFNPDHEEWEIVVFVSNTEVSGGAQDGTTVPFPVHLDICRVSDLFDDPPSIHWQSADVPDVGCVGQHVSFEGTVRGNRVWLRVLAQAPDEVGPGRLVHAFTGQLEDLW